jgi:hypothetical protein
MIENKWAKKCDQKRIPRMQTIQGAKIRAKERRRQDYHVIEMPPFW